MHVYVRDRMRTFLLKGTRSHVNLMFVLKSQTDDGVNVRVIMIAKLACEMVGGCLEQKSSGMFKKSLRELNDISKIKHS